MKSRAYLLINVQNPLQNYYQAATELRDIAGVKIVEQTSGLYDFLVQVETNDKVSPILDSLMSKPWLRRMHVLHPAELENNTYKKKGDIPAVASEIGENAMPVDTRIPTQSWLNSSL